MYTTDRQMLKLIDILKASNKVRFDTDFCEAIGLRKQNLYNIRQDTNHFTPEHIENAIKVYKVNANWIFGVSDVIFFVDNSLSTIVEKTETRS